jgi:NAD(P)-dependent dehydrogenase (short-subunit alcohol dehydrogenase family)
MILEDKVAIVTGAARGIGLACAERLAAEGAKVVLTDVDEDGGARAESELRAAGRDVRFVAGSVSERLDVYNLMAVVLESYERVDILVNNAGIIDDAPFLDLAFGEFERIFQTNVMGTFLVGQAVARQMVKQAQEQGGHGPAGSIVNMASVNSKVAMPDHVAYCATKGAIAQLTKAMALALAPHRIRVNAVGPGSIMTPMLADVAKDEEARRLVLSRTPIGRFGRPDEIASIVAFLVSNEASYITGEIIYADGGRLPLNYTVSVPDGA